MSIYLESRYLYLHLLNHSLYIYSEIFILINISILHFVLSILIKRALKSINFSACCHVVTSALCEAEIKLSKLHITIRGGVISPSNCYVNNLLSPATAAVYIYDL